MRKIPAKLAPARPADVRAQHVPILPDWYPLPEAGKPALPESKRVAERRARQVREATAGPYDGARVVVLADGSGPPKRYVPLNAPTFTYALDDAESTQHQLVYRYDMDSPAHRDAMLAVEAAFAEAGRDYAIAAREEDDNDRSAPR